MPTLVLMPGLHGTAELFAPLRDQIPATIPVIMLRYPTRRISSATRLLRHIETTLAGQSNLILIAESYSGPLALKFALAHPDQVCAVVLAASFVRAPVPRLLSLVAYPFTFLQLPLPNFLLRWFLAGHGASRPLLRQMRREINANLPWVLAHRVASTAWIDATAALKHCTVPVLCLAGSKDRLIGNRAHKRIRRCRPDVRVKLFDAPHLLLQRRPKECWDEIASFAAHGNPAT